MVLCEKIGEKSPTWTDILILLRDKTNQSFENLVFRQINEMCNHDLTKNGFINIMDFPTIEKIANIFISRLLWLSELSVHLVVLDKTLVKAQECSHEELHEKTKIQCVSVCSCGTVIAASRDTGISNREPLTSFECELINSPNHLWLYRNYIGHTCNLMDLLYKTVIHTALIINKLLWCLSFSLLTHMLKKNFVILNFTNIETSIDGFIDPWIRENANVCVDSMKIEFIDRKNEFSRKPHEQNLHNLYLEDFLKGEFSSIFIKNFNDQTNKAIAAVLLSFLQFLEINLNCKLKIEYEKNLVSLQPLCKYKTIGNNIKLYRLLALLSSKKLRKEHFYYEKINKKLILLIYSFSNSDLEFHHLCQNPSTNNIGIYHHTLIFICKVVKRKLSQLIKLLKKTQKNPRNYIVLELLNQVFICIKSVKYLCGCLEGSSHGCVKLVGKMMAQIFILQIFVVRYIEMIDEKEEKNLGISVRNIRVTLEIIKKINIENKSILIWMNWAPILLCVGNNEILFLTQTSRFVPNEDNLPILWSSTDKTKKMFKDKDPSFERYDLLQLIINHLILFNKKCENKLFLWTCQQSSIKYLIDFCFSIIMKHCFKGSENTQIKTSMKGITGLHNICSWDKTYNLTNNMRTVVLPIASNLIGFFLSSLSENSERSSIFDELTNSFCMLIMTVVKELLNHTEKIEIWLLYDFLIFLYQLKCDFLLNITEKTQKIENEIIIKIDKLLKKCFLSNDNPLKFDLTIVCMELLRLNKNTNNGKILEFLSEEVCYALFKTSQTNNFGNNENSNNNLFNGKIFSSIGYEPVIKSFEIHKQLFRIHLLQYLETFVLYECTEQIKLINCIIHEPVCLPSEYKSINIQNINYSHKVYVPWKYPVLPNTEILEEKKKTYCKCHIFIQTNNICFGCLEKDLDGTEKYSVDIIKYFPNINNDFSYLEKIVLDDPDKFKKLIISLLQLLHIQCIKLEKNLTSSDEKELEILFNKYSKFPSLSQSIIRVICRILTGLIYNKNIKILKEIYSILCSWNSDEIENNNVNIDKIFILKLFLKLWHIEWKRITDRHLDSSSINITKILFEENKLIFQDKNTYLHDLRILILTVLLYFNKKNKKSEFTIINDLIILNDGGLSIFIPYMTKQQLNNNNTQTMVWIGLFPFYYKLQRWYKMRKKLISAGRPLKSSIRYINDEIEKLEKIMKKFTDKLFEISWY